MSALIKSYYEYKNALNTYVQSLDTMPSSLAFFLPLRRIADEALRTYEAAYQAATPDERVELEVYRLQQRILSLRWNLELKDGAYDYAQIEAAQKELANTKLCFSPNYKPQVDF